MNDKMNDKMNDEKIRWWDGITRWIMRWTIKRWDD